MIENPPKRKAEKINEIIPGDEVQIICPRASGLNVCRKYVEEVCEERYVVHKDEYEPDFYPPHCHGFSYILRNDLVHQILDGDQTFTENGRKKRFRMEDVYITGILAEVINPKYFDIS